MLNRESRIVDWLPGPFCVAALVAFWAVATTQGFVGPARLPSPKDLWESFEQMMTIGYAGGTLPQQVWHSMRLVLMGFTVAILTGVPLGILMGLSRRAEAFINPAFLLIRPIPPLAWIPLAILWFGLGDGSKIFIIWFGAFVPALINTYTGVRSVDQGLIAAARVHGAKFRHVLFEVVIPGALPLIFTGLYLALQASWTALVAAELVGAFFGLGRVLMTAARDINPGMIAAAMICVALLGAGMTYLLSLIEAWAMPWRRR